MTSNEMDWQQPWSLQDVADFLAVGSESLRGQGACMVTGIAQDSRQVRPGDIFAALPGAEHHGGAFAVEAAARGAVAVVSDRATEVLPTLVVPSPRKVLGPLAAQIFRLPSTKLDVYGVTGTNGKTSTAYMLEAALASAGLRPGLVSGVCVRGPDNESYGERTTPEACALQRTLASFVSSRVHSVAMEVSSHGLTLNRVDGTFFRVAAFTNLSRDHLDFHGTMRSYFESKAELFTTERCSSAVIGVDDVYGRALAACITVPRLTFSSQGTAADVFATDIDPDGEGTTFIAHQGNWRQRIRLRLRGGHQVDNALAAIAALSMGDVDITAAVDGIENLETVPGRLEPVEAGQNFLAFVDYVHNPGAQGRLFPYLRTLATGKLILVVGATGGRDPGKRAPLGLNAGKHADIVIVTDESPLYEDSESLRNEVAGAARLASHAEVLIIADRRAAIRGAVGQAKSGDVVVVAGRGRDRVVNCGGMEAAFDDHDVLELAVVESMR